MSKLINNHLIQACCEALRVSRSGYYAWKKRGSKSTDVDNAVRSCFEKHKARAGAPKIHKEVQAQGLMISQRTVGRKMAKLGLRPRYIKPFRYPKNKNQSRFIAENLLDRQFCADAPNRKWVSDISYLRTTEGWLYLCVVIDLYSRAVIGWQLSESVDQHLVLDAIRAALLARAYPKHVLFHSDQGSQYTCDSVQSILNQYQMTVSMSRRANCWDNSVAESFFRNLKQETFYNQSIQNKQLTKRAVFEYIECYYNTVRRHSAINYDSPRQFELKYRYNQLSEVSTV
jgi:transposase InsO family protein